MIKKVFVLLAGLMINFGLAAESFQDLRTVSGVITAFKTVPLNKVRILAVKSGASVYTDSDGVFSIKCADKDLLVISAAGFRERKIKVGNEEMYKVDLSYIDNETNFNEATSHGHISSDILRQSIITKASRKEKDYSKYQTIYELISSEIYNVRVKGSSVVNTKVRSFDSNPQVLYVVDNVIVSDISYINPVYVKTIEFIDDVGTTLYGSKGANGVLKITLK
jgi:hypothetical protein